MYNEWTFFRARAAFYALLRAFGVGSGDRVLLPGYTCAVVPMAVKFAGAVPEYTDIDPASYNALLADYQEAYDRLLRNGTAENLKLIVVQHTYGNPNRDLVPIKNWAQTKRLRIIEDCAHLMSESGDGAVVGRTGDAVFFSTQWSKPITTGVGGIARVNVTGFDEAMRSIQAEMLPPTAWENAALGVQFLLHKSVLTSQRYWFARASARRVADFGVFVGSSTSWERQGRMPPDYCKLMGLVQRWALNRGRRALKTANEHRRRIANFYDELFEVRGLRPFLPEPGAVVLRYPVRVRDKTACLAEAQRLRLELGDWFNRPLHPATFSLEGLNWDDAHCPRALEAAQSVVNLPTHPRVDVEQAVALVNFVSKWVPPRVNPSIRLAFAQPASFKSEI